MRRSHLKSGSFDLAKKLPSLIVFMVWQFGHRHVWPSLDPCCSLLVVKFMATPHLLQFLWLARRCFLWSHWMRSSFSPKMMGPSSISDMLDFTAKTLRAHIICYYYYYYWCWYCCNCALRMDGAECTIHLRVHVLAWK